MTPYQDHLLHFVQPAIIFGAIIVLGACIKLASLARGIWVAEKVRKAATPISATDKPMLPAWRERTIAISDRIDAPALVGVFRPALLLPTRLLSKATKAELRAIFSHEAAHAARRDPIFALLEAVIGAFYWWSPVMGRLRRRMAFCRETACDRIAARELGALAYARALVAVAKKIGAPPKPALHALHAHFGVSQRVAMLINSAPRRPGRWIAAIVMSVIFAAGFAGVTPRLGAGALDANLAPMAFQSDN